MSDEQNGHGLSRLDRMEGLMQLLIDDHLKFRDDLRQLLTAQVVQGDRIDKMVEAQKQMVETQKQLEETQQDAQERLDALILTVDDLIRRLPA
jgi:seryl-tRNA synthetase